MQDKRPGIVLGTVTATVTLAGAMQDKRPGTVFGTVTVTVTVAGAMQDKQPVWEALLQFAVSNGVDALVDCGALLAGASNRCIS